MGDKSITQVSWWYDVFDALLLFIPITVGDLCFFITLNVHGAKVVEKLIFFVYFLIYSISVTKKHQKKMHFNKNKENLFLTTCRIGNFSLSLLYSFKIALFKKWPWANLLMSLLTRAICSSKKSNVSDLLMILANRLQKSCYSIAKFIIYVCFWQFFPFFMPNSESLPSPFAH